MGTHHRVSNSIKPQLVLNKKVDPETGNYSYMLVKACLSIWESKPRSPLTRTPQHYKVFTRVGGRRFEIREGYRQEPVFIQSRSNGWIRQLIVEDFTREWFQGNDLSRSFGLPR